jgi:hypothetical protein
MIVMTVFVLMILSTMATMILAVIGREIYHTKPGLNMDLTRFAIMVGLEILILTSIMLVGKFV